MIRQGIEVPESQNDLRRMQLRELALLNGTLRETDGPRCSNCGSSTHRSWQCPDKPNVTNNVICINCGATGHISKDCKEKKSQGTANSSKIDEEYMSLMAELGEGPPPPSKQIQSLNTTSSCNTLNTGANSNAAPRSLLPPPTVTPQSNTISPSHSQPLLPTPNLSSNSQQNANFCGLNDTTLASAPYQQQSYWNTAQAASYGYGTPVTVTMPTNVGAYSSLPTDTYSHLYSQTQTNGSNAAMSWMQQGM